jgi:hypothetical protein
MIWYDMIYLLTAIGLSPGGSRLSMIWHPICQEKSKALQSVSIPWRQHLWLQFLYIQVLSYFNLFNLHLVFLTLPIYNLVIVSLKSPARSQSTFDNLIQFHIVTIIIKHMGSHSVDTIVLYFALHSKYCNGGLMLVFRPKHVAIFKYR